MESAVKDLPNLSEFRDLTHIPYLLLAILLVDTFTMGLTRFMPEKVGGETLNLWYNTFGLEGVIADVFIIWCKDESNKIIGLVTERNDAISTPEIKEKLSLLSSPTGYIYMDNLKIPKKNKLDIVGLRGPFECLNKARYGISWGVIGAMENIINTAIDYSEERHQFSKPLTTFQLIQQDLIKSIELYSSSLNNSFASLNKIETFSDLENNLELISFLKRVN
jgi:glutaryl-CoA dehydrogenase